MTDFVPDYVNRRVFLRVVCLIGAILCINKLIEITSEFKLNAANVNPFNLMVGIQVIIILFLLYYAK